MLESSAGSDGQAGSFDEVTVRPLQRLIFVRLRSGGSRLSGLEVSLKSQVIADEQLTIDRTLVYFLK
jgi:hypothetical protein